MRALRYFLKIMVPIMIFVIISACASNDSADGSESSAKVSDAEEYPNKPIKIIVHTSSGGPTDTMARELADAAEPILGQDIIIENKPGGSGAAQMEALQSGDSDGYTLATMTPTHVGAWNSSLKGQYSPDDFTFVSRVQLDPYVLAVNSDSEFETLEDLVSYMKENPGEVNVGGYGAVGSGHNVAWNIFAEAAGVEGEWTNYESTSDAVTALLGNHIDVANSNPAKVDQYVESGELRVLGVFADESLESMPNVPTYEEAGVPIDVEWSQFRGIYTNEDVPEEVIEKLSEAFKEAMQTEDFKQFMEDAQVEDGSMGHEEFSDFVEDQVKVNQEWLNKLGIE